MAFYYKFQFAFVFLVQIISFRINFNSFLVSKQPVYDFVNKLPREDVMILNSGFDESFADAMSKPLPEWYIDERKKLEEYQKELENTRNNREREFSEKYDNTNVNSDDTSKKSISTEDMESANKEQEGNKFSLPGFFEVFPELKLKWPKWARKRDGGQIECKTDKDCRFPQACCPHPLFPGQKFCCTGYGQRIMEPAYVGQEIQGDLARGRKVGENDPPLPPDPNKRREVWRPDPY